MSDSYYSTEAFYAAFAADVYDPGSGNLQLDPAKDLSGFARPPEQNSPDTLRQGDFYGRIYQKGSMFVVAFRGTDDFQGDAATNVESGFGYGLTDPQFASAAALIKRALKEAGAISCGGVYTS